MPHPRCLSLSYFVFSLSLLLSLSFSLHLSITLSLFLSPCSLSPPSRHPSPCLQQPYKPWSSAGASSFTRAMYLDVSEGRNFASVCVNRSSLSRSLFVTPPFLSCRPSPLLFFALHPPLSPTLHGPLCPLPLRVSVLVRYQECVRATCPSRRVQVCETARTQTRAHKRVHTDRVTAYVHEGKFGLSGCRMATCPRDISNDGT